MSGIQVGKTRLKGVSLPTGLISLFIMAHFGHHLLTALPTPLLPMIRKDFGLDYTQSALVVSAFTLPYGISQLPAGWLGDRLGPRLLITIGICGVALVGVLVGLSQTYIMLIVLLGLMGVVGGGYHPSAAPLISTLVEAKNRGRALGLHLIGGSGSYFLAPIVAAAIASVWGWRGAFLSLAVPAIIFGLAFYFLLGKRAAKKPEQVTTNPLANTAPTSSMRRLIVFLVLTTFVSGTTQSVIALIPLFLVDHFNVSSGTAALFLSLTYSAGLWASPLGGYLSDRLGRIPVILAGCFLVCPVIYALNLVPYGFAIGTLLLLVGMVMYVRGPASEAFIFGETSPKHRSAIYGIYYFSGMEAGAIFAPVLGYLVDRFGFYTSFSAASVVLLLATSVCAIVLRTEHKKAVLENPS